MEDITSHLTQLYRNSQGKGNIIYYMLEGVIFFHKTWKKAKVTPAFVKNPFHALEGELSLSPFDIDVVEFRMQLLDL